MQKYEEKIDLIEKQNVKLEKQNKELVSRIASIAEKSASKPTINNTTNNQQNNIINMQPITDEHLRNSAEFLTLEHILQGAQGYSCFATQHPLSGRINCVDFSRRKIQYKDERGDMVTDPEMTKLLQRLFIAIEEKNSSLIDEHSTKLKSKLFRTDGPDNMTEEQSNALTVHTDAIIDRITEIDIQKKIVKDIAKGYKPEMFHQVAKDICSRNCV